jgi:hypothetical protein
MGVTPNEFWQMSPRQIRVLADGFAEREKRQTELTDLLNHMLGKYIRYAFNDPKHYPKKPFLDSTKEVKRHIAYTGAQRQRYARLRYKKKD